MKQLTFWMFLSFGASAIGSAQTQEKDLESLKRIVAIQQANLRKLEDSQRIYSFSINQLVSKGNCTKLKAVEDFNIHIVRDGNKYFAHLNANISCLNTTTAHNHQYWGIQFKGFPYKPLKKSWGQYDRAWNAEKNGNEAYMMVNWGWDSSDTINTIRLGGATGVWKPLPNTIYNFRVGYIEVEPI